MLQYSSGLALSHSSTSATNGLQETDIVDGDLAVIGASISAASSVINGGFTMIVKTLEQ